jgi:ABC-type glycerol-3-phosphate transport system substrate-binding protein
MKTIILLLGVAVMLGLAACAEEPTTTTTTHETTTVAHPATTQQTTTTRSSGGYEFGGNTSVCGICAEFSTKGN